VYGRLFWDRPSNTITAFARNPASGRYVHPQQDRGMSIREAALLQGFPLDYQFKGSFDHRFLQIGNAVPPTFSAYLAAHILAHLGRKQPWIKDITDDFDNWTPMTKSFSSSIAGRKGRAA
jgi:DNA (cytosine-5)-methyltransferase 1